MYLCSAPYAPEREHTILATDPQLAIDWPTVAARPRGCRIAIVDAPTLDDVRAAGLLPNWDDCRDFIDRLRRGG